MAFCWGLFTTTKRRTWKWSVFLALWQWRIQDFPDGAPIPDFGAKTYYLARFFAENCMKKKEIGLREGWGGRVPSRYLMLTTTWKDKVSRCRELCLLLFQSHFRFRSTWNSLYGKMISCRIIVSQLVPNPIPNVTKKESETTAVLLPGNWFPWRGTRCCSIELTLDNKG